MTVIELLQLSSFPKYVDRFNIVYFRENKNIVAILTKNNREQTEKMKEVEIAKFIEWEKKHLKISEKKEPYYLNRWQSYQGIQNIQENVG